MKGTFLYLLNVLLTIAFAMVLLFPAVTFLFPAAVFLVFVLRIQAAPACGLGYLLFIRSVCKIE